jgi:hypothetical protein
MKRIIPYAWRQLKLIFQLAFHPDLDSSVYLNRTRLNIAIGVILLLDLVYVLMWSLIFKDSQSLGHTHEHNLNLLATAASIAALAGLNLQWRFIPKISPLALCIFCLWLNLPLLAFYNYLVVKPHLQALATTIIILMMYMHIQDWRVSLTGVFLAAIAAPLVYWFKFDAWPVLPSLLQGFILASAIGGAVVVSATTANITKMRKRYTEKVLKISAEQMRTALELQTELIGNLRYEARNIIKNEAQRLALDCLALDMDAQMEHLRREIKRLNQTGEKNLQDWEKQGLLRTSDILAMARYDLANSYHFAENFLEAALKTELQDDVILEGNGVETSQAIASLIAPILHACQIQGHEHPMLNLRCWSERNLGKLHIFAINKEGLSQPTSASAVELAPFTAYVFHQMHVTWQVQTIFADGTPADMTLTAPPHTLSIPRSV